MRNLLCRRNALNLLRLPFTFEKCNQYTVSFRDGVRFTILPNVITMAMRHYNSILSTCLFYLLMLLIGCGVEESEHSQTFDSANDPAILDQMQRIDMTAPKRDQRLTDWINIRDVITLETNAASALQGVSKVLHIQDKFIVVHNQSAAIKVFSEEGKYLYDIGAIGKGPGEFLYIFGVDHLPGTDELLMYGRTELVRFHLDGRLINEKSTPSYGFYFAAIDADHYAIHMNNMMDDVTQNHNVLILDRNMEITSRGLAFQSGNKGYSYTGYLAKSDEGIIAQTAFSDTIYEYSVQDEVFYPKYVFDFGVDRKSVPLNSPHIMDIRRKEGYLKSPFFETENALCFRYDQPMKNRAACWLKAESTLLTEESFAYPQLLFHLFPPKGQTQEGLSIAAIVPGEMYFGVPDYHTVIQRDSSLLPYLKQSYPALYEVSRELDGSENPILVIYELSNDANHPYDTWNTRNEGE